MCSCTSNTKKLINIYCVNSSDLWWPDPADCHLQDWPVTAHTFVRQHYPSLEVWGPAGQSAGTEMSCWLLACCFIIITLWHYVRISVLLIHIFRTDILTSSIHPGLIGTSALLSHSTSLSELLHHESDSTRWIQETLLVRQLSCIYDTGEGVCLLWLWRWPLPDPLQGHRWPGEDETHMGKGTKAAFPCELSRLRDCWQSEQALRSTLWKPRCCWRRQLLVWFESEHTGNTWVNILAAAPECRKTAVTPFPH